MIKREKYIAPIRSFYDSDLIKIITGVRRCGKSEILKQIKSEIADKSDNIIYLNFEDRIVTEQIQEWKVEERLQKGTPEYVSEKPNSDGEYIEYGVADKSLKACKNE